jgi:uncharacterized membrane protein
MYARVLANTRQFYIQSVRHNYLDFGDLGANQTWYCLPTAKNKKKAQVMLFLHFLSLQLPNFPSNIVESERMRRSSQTLIPSIIHYIISFMVVETYCISYHRIFELIRHTNITLVWLNLLFLLFISLTAYFTGLFTSYATHEIVVTTFAGIWPHRFYVIHNMVVCYT